MPSHDHDHADFEAFYAEGRKWSGNPNDALVREAGSLRPARALDIGCGEGADLVWLAGQGWQVTGIDPVATAVERARSLIDARNLDVEVIRAGVADFTPEQPFDLVSCSYLPVGAEAVAAVEKFVAPGGTLLWVHHDFGADGRPGIVLPPQVGEALSGDFVVDKLETVSRHVSHGAGAHHGEDLVLVARRKEG